MKLRHLFYLGLGVAVLAISSLTAQQLLNHQTATTTINSDNSDNADFSLTQNQQTVHLKDFRGKLVLLYFGYASCPDVCPTSLALLGSVLKALSPAEVAQIQPMFISVDPARDHGNQLMDYARYFYPSFIGLTGTEQEIQLAARQYGAFYSKVASNSALGYTVDHSSNSYLIGKEGQLLTTFKHDASKADVLAGIRAALNH